MFRINGIYRAQNIQEPMAHGEPYIRTYREYVTPSGEKVNEVIFEEYGYSSREYGWF